VLQERGGRFDDALATLERALHEDPSIAQLQKNHGDLLYRAGRYDDALESYQRAVKMQPDLGSDVYLKLGNVRFRRQEPDEAVRCWERALELDPGNAIVRTNLEAVRQTL
jgi:tetratricopeptide (TPR) repeat protein